MLGYFGERRLFYARNVRARNTHFLRDLALCQRICAEKPVPQANDAARAGIEPFFNYPFCGGGAHGCVEVVGNGVLYAYYVAVGEGVALLIRIYRFTQRNFAGAFFLRAEVHKNFVRYPLLTARHILTNPR